MATPAMVTASMTLAAFVNLLQLWVETLKMRLAAVEAPVRVSRFIPGATSYSAQPTRRHEGSTLAFDSDSECWHETFEAPLCDVKDDARQEQHRLLQALGLLRAILESTEMQDAHWTSIKSPNGEQTFVPLLQALSVREVRETLGAVGIDPTLVVLPKWPDRVWL